MGVRVVLNKTCTPTLSEVFLVDAVVPLGGVSVTIFAEKMPRGNARYNHCHKASREQPGVGRAAKRGWCGGVAIHQTRIVGCRMRLCVYLAPGANVPTACLTTHMLPWMLCITQHTVWLQLWPFA